jgi:signal transduction histidine kinase
MIHLNVEKVDNLPDILLHVSSMQQVFMNLLSNAIDAVQQLENKIIQIKTSYDNNHIQISFTDNGCGIREDIQHAIFNPFFTNKPVGEGTGLGLSISKSIVENHYGQLVCKSSSKDGTTFTIVLPIHYGKNE